MVEHAALACGFALCRRGRPGREILGVRLDSSAVESNGRSESVDSLTVGIFSMPRFEAGVFDPALQLRRCSGLRAAPARAFWHGPAADPG